MTLRVDDENINTIDSIICQYYVSVIKSNLCVSHTSVKGALFRGTSRITVKLSEKLQYSIQLLQQTQFFDTAWKIQAKFISL